MVFLFKFLFFLLFGLNFAEDKEFSGYAKETYWILKEFYQPAEQLTYQNFMEKIDSNVEKLVFIAHGWLDSRFSGWFYQLSHSFLVQHPTWNIIQVDWSVAASSLDYYVASNNSILVGTSMGKFLNDIINSSINITTEKILLVGHSLGAHVTGFAAKTSSEQGNVISRVVGLDPAFPVWNDLPCEQRLCKEDTKFLSVIHTDCGYSGIVFPIGHADFYANNGTNQPGCNVIPGMQHICNHVRAIYYFMEGVLFPDHFEAKNCPDYETYIYNPSACENITARMADLVSTKEGKFYLKTNAFPPYSIN